MDEHDLDEVLKQIALDEFFRLPPYYRFMKFSEKKEPIPTEADGLEDDQA